MRPYRIASPIGHADSCRQDWRRVPTAKSDEISDVSKLPKAVQKTVKEQVADGKIVKIQKENTDGKIAYGVECAKGEKKWQIEVAPDGRLLLRAEEMNPANLSAAVQKTVEQSAAKGKIESIAKVTENGQSYYEAAVTFNGLEKTFIVGGRWQTHRYPNARQ